MDTIINKTKELIRKQTELGTSATLGLNFEECSKAYAFTNERLVDVLEFINFGDLKNALTVTSSGDHAFNLINKGIYNIDTFDVNLLSNYFALGLKRAMILKYSYQEFLEIIKIFKVKFYSFDDVTQIIVDLLPYMDNEYRKFWGEIVAYYYNLQKEKHRCIGFNLFQILLRFAKDPLLFNNYLKNEEEYNRLKQRISYANITFKQADAINLPEQFTDSYDIIMLSNIINHFKSTNPIKKEEGFNLYVDSLKNMLNENGIIFLNYFLNPRNSSYNFIRPDLERVFLDNSGHKDSFLLVRKDNN